MESSLPAAADLPLPTFAVVTAAAHERALAEERAARAAADAKALALFQEDQDKKLDAFKAQLDKGAADFQLRLANSNGSLPTTLAFAPASAPGPSGPAVGGSSYRPHSQVGKAPTYDGKVKPALWLDKVLQFFKAARVPPSDYVLHALPLLEMNSVAHHWHRSIQAKYPDMSWDLFTVLLTQHFTRDQREPQQVCRDDLHSGKIMHTNSVAAYVQRFRLATMEAVDMSETDLINWFLRGLSPQLKPHCLTDHVGVFWSSIEDLITYAYAKETMLKAQGLIRTPRESKSSKSHHLGAAGAAHSQGSKRKPHGTQADGFTMKKPRHTGTGQRGTTGAKYGAASTARDDLPPHIKPAEGSSPDDVHHKYMRMTNKQVVHCYAQHICPECFKTTVQGEGENPHRMVCTKKGKFDAVPPADLMSRQSSVPRSR